MQLAHRHGNERPHAAVDMNAQHFQIGAAVPATAATGDAPTAIQVRLDRTPITALQPVTVFIDFKNLNAQLVANNARVVEEWLAAVVSMQVRSADANAVHAHERRIQ